MSSRAQARAAKARLAARYAADGVVSGVGVRRRHGDWVVTVRLRERHDDDPVPSVLDGVTVVVEVIGEVHPQAPEQSP